MGFRAVPGRIYLAVLKGPNVSDTKAMRDIVKTQSIDLSRVKHAHSFVPLLTAQITPQGVNPDSFRAVFRYEYHHRGRLIGNWFQVQSITPGTIQLQPKSFFLLDRFRTHFPMTGLWKVNVSIAFLRQEENERIQNMVSRRVSYQEDRVFYRELVSDKLRQLNLQFQELANFEFQVTDTASIGISADGDLLQPRQEQHQTVQVSIDDL